MKLKSFFAGTVEAALGLAREELGEEAVLVESRKAPPEAQHLGQYEVVVAALDPREAEKVSAAGPRSAEGPKEPPEAKGLERELAQLRREMERLRSAVWQSGVGTRGAAALAGGGEALGTLLEAGLDPPLAHEIAACVEARRLGDPLVGGDSLQAGAGRLPDWRPLLKLELERRIHADPLLGRPEAALAAAALVGPPGSGKTTTLVKLAVRLGLEKRRPVRIVSMDNYRVAGSEPLRTYAAILGVGFRCADSAAALRQALAEASSKDLVLIDTPGFAPGDAEAAAELAEILRSYPEVEVHLTLAATTRNADLTCAVDRFERFRPSKLLFTRLDEATSFGPAFSEAVRTAKPVSFLAGGQRIPEDLEEAGRERLIGLLLG
jgi:flagellar biosynthesis protein FlhF